VTAVLPDGLRAEIEEITLELREELGLACDDRLDPRALADHLAIEVDSIELFQDIARREVRRMTKFDQDALSAATCFCKPKCRILVNPAQSPTQERESIAHELGHILLEHEPTWPPFDETGKRRSRPLEEEEADQMAAAMLVPAAGVAPVLAAYGGDAGAAADHFGVSVRLMRRRVEQACPPAVVALEAEAAAVLVADETLQESPDLPASADC
jgi:Zn-dependent peptidase ImmA (M78 family)